MTLELRVAKLERDNRRLRLAWVATALLAGGAMLAGQGGEPPVAEEVTARRFVVVDEDGAERATLGLSADTDAPDDETRVALTLFDGAGVEGVWLGHPPGGEPALILDRGEGVASMLGASELHLQQQGAAYEVNLGPKGVEWMQDRKWRVALRSNERGTRLALSDGREAGRTVLASTDPEAGGISIHQDGVTLWRPDL